MEKVLTVKYPLALIAAFIWVGFVCAISFMEAWLKFRAPGIDLPLGLGIGRLVFAALNKVEWVLATAVLFNYLFAGNRDFQWHYILFFIALIVLILQTVYFLPALDARAELYIQQEPVPPSNMHFVYVIVEAVKVISLIVFGLKLFKWNPKYRCVVTFPT